MNEGGQADSGRKIRRIVQYGGYVQGVGFRYTACRVAERFCVTGYVKNLPDGQVELLAEGDAAEVDAFVEAVQRQMGRHIHHARVQEGFATGEYTDFRVAHF
jgi:acylphosphatase